MANEILHIENFAGIKNADIELSAMNVFIGPQASGKSVCAKLFFFFKQCLANLAYDITNYRTKSAISVAHKETFSRYFPLESWSEGKFVVRYVCGEMWIEVVRKSASSHSVEITYSPRFDAQLSLVRKTVKRMLSSIDDDSTFLQRAMINQKGAVKFRYGDNPSSKNDNYFVPAGRSFFSTLRSSVFQFIANDLEIDPFLVEFGSFYESVRRRLAREDFSGHKMSKSINKLLCGKYQRDVPKSKDYLVMSDNRRVAIENCSSGQQETLPLVLGLLSLSRNGKKAKSNTMFIEEPEAHLYPTAQREIVHFITSTIDFVSEDSTSQCVITTHSPYILTALNNLMYASKIAEEAPEKRKLVAKIIDETAFIPPSRVRAYYFENGTVRSIINAENELILATEIDDVSTEIAVEFERLMDIEFTEAAA